MTELENKIGAYFETEVIPLSDRAIASRLGCGKSSVNNYRNENGIKDLVDRKTRTLYKQAQVNARLTAQLKRATLRADLLLCVSIALAIVVALVLAGRV